MMIALDEQCRPVLARGVRLQLDPLTGEPLLLFPEGFLQLDEITHAILLHCSGRHTLEAIIRSLSHEYEADLNTLRTDVYECLNQLRQQMLVALSL
jgi:pyrroloquinoline quinone biosynthesis protein D